MKKKVIETIFDGFSFILAIIGVIYTDFVFKQTFQTINLGFLLLIEIATGIILYLSIWYTLMLLFYKEKEEDSEAEAFDQK